MSSLQWEYHAFTPATSAQLVVLVSDFGPKRFHTRLKTRRGWHGWAWDEGEWGLC